MAVENKWASALVEAGKKDNTAKVAGGKILCLASTFEVAAADDDGSVYKLAKLPANAIPVKCEIVNDAIAGATDYDLGLYNEDGSEADKDLFMDGADISAGNPLSAPLDGLQTGPAIDKTGQKVWELLGKTLDNKLEGYVLALTANTVGAAAGTISYRFYYILG